MRGGHGQDPGGRASQVCEATVGLASLRCARFRIPKPSCHVAFVVRAGGRAPRICEADGRASVAPLCPFRNDLKPSPRAAHRLAGVRHGSRFLEISCPRSARPSAASRTGEHLQTHEPTFFKSYSEAFEVPRTDLSCDESCSCYPRVQPCPANICLSQARLAS
jgi:hypothetical protein